MPDLGRTDRSTSGPHPDNQRHMQRDYPERVSLLTEREQPIWKILSELVVEARDRPFVPIGAYVRRVLEAVDAES